MPTCLVTGGAGFLGSHLCDELLRRGNRVICVDNVETGSLANIEHIRAPEFRFFQADIIQPYFIDEAVDFVYHFASPASPIDYLRLPLHTLKVAKAHRARFLTASTSEVYGDPKVHPQPESYWGHVNPIGPRGVYDEAKRYAEALTMAYLRQQGVNTSIVRIFNTYGPRMRPNDGRAIPTFVRQALANAPLTVFGDGTQTRRVNLYWGGRVGVAQRRPARATDPADPAYDWTLYDRTVNYAAQHKIRILFSIFGTPGWANRGKGANRAPTRAADLRNFAAAAARR